MITGIEIVVFKVSDLNRACEFYEKSLGLKIAYRDGDAGWAEVDLVAIHLGLHQAEPSGAARNPYMSLRVDDLDATVTELKGRGVEFVGEPVTESFGRMITVKDPDGNQFELFEPGE